MDSEKVKEIKEKLKGHYYYLDQAYSDYLAYGGKADEQQEEKIHFFGDILTLINELESENKELRVVVDIANERAYRKKFTDEWRKEYQKELDKQGNGHIAGYPDFDLVYKLYFEQKERIVELEKENETKTDTIANLLKKQEFYEKDKLKRFAEKLKNKLFEFFQDNEELDGKISVGPLYVDVIGVEAKDGTIISLGLIDELLKECLND